MKKVSLLVVFLWLGIMGASAQEDRCDVNGDGEVNIADVTYVLDHILGKGHASTPTEESGEAIDLGLPSGTKWASCNLGANTPEEFGGYYAWGETEEKDIYNESTYAYYHNGSFEDIGSDISGTEYDVAHVKWGGKWYLPTKDDFTELYSNCKCEWTTLNDVDGYMFISKANGNSIFIPANGNRRNDRLEYTGRIGYYWTSIVETSYVNVAYTQSFDSNLLYQSARGRATGHGVRPVMRD